MDRMTRLVHALQFAHDFFDNVYQAFNDFCAAENMRPTTDLYVAALAKVRA